MIRSFRHKGLRTLHQRGDTSGVRADHIARLRRLLASLDVAQAPNDMDRPGNRLHPLKGKLDGFWSVAVSGNWRVIFRFDGSDVELVDYLDYHQEAMMPMHNPPHPGEALREDVLPAINMSVAALARHIGYSRGQLSTVLNGHAAISADLAHRLELAGLGSARQYLAEQAAYDLWQAVHREHPPIARLQIA